MKLQSFRIRNYRSVNDSGLIEAGDCVSLVGRNESGKTNLLLALESLNPPDREIEELSFVKDFPRDRSRDDFSEELGVVETTWTLSDQEKRELVEIFPRAKGVSQVTVSRRYKDSRYIGLVDLPALTVDAAAVEQHFTKITQSIRGSLSKLDEADKATILGTIEHLTIAPSDDPSALEEWASTILECIEIFNDTLTEHDIETPNLAKQHLGHLTEIAEQISQDKDSHAAARKWVVKTMPIFIYLADYPELLGHQSIPDLVRALDRERDLTEADKNFLRLCKVAGLDPQELNELLSHSHEERQQLANRAGAVVTKKIRELWKDRQLTIRFNLDANHFDTLVSDPSAAYPVEINFDERSRGFKWFFSFYTALAADTAGGPAENAILLLDEPGLYLHAVAQRDLLQHFDADFSNQIIYTTHSAFMIPTYDISRIRTVTITEERGTEVTNDVQGDSKTLFPLQSALGYDLTQTLFIGDKNIVVEGVTDYWYLSSISEYLRDNGTDALPADLVITPAGGAQKVPYMVALLTAQNLKVLVLLDEEPGATRAQEDLIKNKLIRSDNVISITEGYETPPGSAADIEDLLDPGTFDTLVRESYAKELKGKKLQLNENMPRIVKRYEEAFEKLGMSFHKTRPARLFIRKIASDPKSVLTDLTCSQFGRLFAVVTERLTRQIERASKPFI